MGARKEPSARFETYSSGRLLANSSPVLFPDIVVDLDRNIPYVETILAIATRSGYPVLLSGFNVVVIRLKATALEALKGFALVIESAEGLSKSHQTDSSRSVQALRLRFDIHDAGSF